MSKPDVSKSKFLSLVLRHQPEKIGVQLDENGWIEVDTLLSAVASHGMRLGRDELDRLVRENDKQRFAFSEDGSRIRANQGHSIEVDLALEAQEPPETLFHGTVEKFLPTILQEGLRKGERHHVHLSPNLETAVKVGQRRGNPIILEIASGQMHRDGHAFFVSGNGVWLVEQVPPQYLTQLERP
jgi:putative RNA 2'-phosphotransferase